MDVIVWDSLGDTLPSTLHLLHQIARVDGLLHLIARAEEEQLSVQWRLRENISVLVNTQLNVCVSRFVCVCVCVCVRVCVRVCGPSQTSPLMAGSSASHVFQHFITAAHCGANYSSAPQPRVEEGRVYPHGPNELLGKQAPTPPH